MAVTHLMGTGVTALEVNFQQLKRPPLPVAHSCMAGFYRLFSIDGGGVNTYIHSIAYIHT
jgi:hypothetical protein